MDGGLDIRFLEKLPCSTLQQSYILITVFSVKLDSLPFCIDICPVWIHGNDNGINFNSFPFLKHDTKNWGFPLKKLWKIPNGQLKSVKLLQKMMHFTDKKCISW
ncbi:MAG: hypothetical protein DSY83_13015 [Flavobacteriia bacterium]|nr:MAG: hypothetical protein DSY83_13015 [Flavobacteriia bacterium]